MAGRITALRIQQHRKDRVNVFLDGEYAFSLQTIVAAGLRLDAELSDQEIADLRRRDARESAYEDALRFLSYRPRSATEVRRYLEKRQIEAAVADEVLARLIRAGLVNDRQFARFWVESRESARPKGCWALREELRGKGVDSEAIEAAVQDVNEEQSALAAARQRASRWTSLDEQTFRRRLLGFLQRRGFSYGISRRVTARMWEEFGDRGDQQ